MIRDLAVHTEHLGRVYRTREKNRGGAETLLALDDVNLEVARGELFGLLGPNGAGKTTLIKILTTLLAPSHGTARVAGYDVIQEGQKVRPLINMVSGGESSGYGMLTVRENLWMFAQFYGISSREANRRIRELLEEFHMSDRIHTKSYQLSAGLRQKVNIIRGFLTDPDVLFLDEPSLGLDVGASREVRAFVRRWIESDQTRSLLLTTHYMAEADELCDRVAIINDGRVLACDTPANLKRRFRDEPTFQLDTTLVDAGSLGHLHAVAGVQSITHRGVDGRSTLEVVLAEEQAISGVIAAMEAYRIGLLSLKKRETTLEDVFMKLVGKSIDEIELIHDPANT